MDLIIGLIFVAAIVVYWIFGRKASTPESAVATSEPVAVPAAQEPVPVITVDVVPTLVDVVSVDVVSVDAPAAIIKKPRKPRAPKVIADEAPKVEQAPKKKPVAMQIKSKKI